MDVQLHGLIPIVATPFDEIGRLDVPSLRRLVEFQLESGVDGVAVFGMASEGFALTAAERRVILSTVADIVSGRVQIVAGVNGTSTATAIEQAEQARDDGADALMVLPPFMVRPPATTLVDFYGQVAVAAGIPLMVQDAPGVTGVAMSTALINQLSELDGVESVKIEAQPTAPKTGAVVEALAGKQFAVFGGQNSRFCLEEYARGAVGTMPACEFPDLLAPILARWQSGDHASARTAFRRLLPLLLIGLQSGIAWAVHKEILVARGIIAHPTVRYPAAPLDTGSRAAVHTVIDELGLFADAGSGPISRESIA